MGEKVHILASKWYIGTVWFDTLLKNVTVDFLAFLMISYYDTKLCIWVITTALQLCEADSAQVKELPKEEETRRKPHHRQNRAARDSGVAESLEDRDSGFSITDGYGAVSTQSWSFAVQHSCSRQWTIQDVLLLVLITVCLFAGSGNQKMHIELSLPENQRAG